MAVSNFYRLRENISQTVNNTVTVLLTINRKSLIGCGMSIGTYMVALSLDFFARGPPYTCTAAARFRPILIASARLSCHGLCAVAASCCISDEPVVNGRRQISTTPPTAPTFIDRSFPQHVSGCSVM